MLQLAFKALRGHGAALHRQPGDPGRLLRVLDDASIGSSGCADAGPRRPWKPASSSLAAWFATSTSVEGIFGNAGDPQLPENDVALDPNGWSGHTGCVILAPHLTKVTKKSLGMPHWDDATERERRDGQCWQDEDERYNGGQAFKPAPATSAASW